MILRELFAKLGLDVDEASFAKGELAAGIVKAGLEKIVEVAKEVVEHIKENVAETIEYADQLDKTSQAIGMTTEELQQWSYAAGIAASENADLNAGVKHLALNMAEAKKGGEEQTKLFHQLGIKYKNADGTLRSVNDVMEDLADHFSTMPNSAEKTAQAMRLLGKSGADLIPLFNEGREGIAKLRQEADQGLISEESVKAGAELHDELEKLEYVSKSLWRQAIGPLLPAIKELVHRFVEWRKANAAVMAQKIRQYAGLLITVVEKLGATFAFLIKNAEALKILLGAGGLILVFNSLSVAGVRAAGALALAWIKAAAPFVAIGALVAGFLLVFDDIRTYLEDVKAGSKVQHSLFGTFEKQLDEWLKPRDSDPWFVSALKYFVQLLHDAIDVMKEFDIVTGKWKPATSSPDVVNANSPAWKRARVPYGPNFAGAPAKTNELAWYEKLPWFGQTVDSRYRDARQGGASTWESAKAAFGYGEPLTYRPAVGGGKQVIIQAPVTIPVYAVPGMDAEAVAKIAADKASEHWDRKMEEANAEQGP